MTKRTRAADVHAHASTEPKKLRRPAVGGYARGDETRQRIITAALELFGAHGFGGTSTREIAARAGVNAPALQYYFENKEGLYRACVEAMAEQAWLTFGPPIERAQAVLADPAAGADAAIYALLGILRAVAEKMYCAAELKTPNVRLFFAREQLGEEPPIATEILMQRVRRPLHAACTALLERITGEPSGSELTGIRSLSLFGQFVIFHTAPLNARMLLGWPATGDDHAAVLSRTLLAQTRALLEVWRDGAAGAMR